jgi:NAD dependent epimerase/dehydratase family enzyme
LGLKGIVNGVAPVAPTMRQFYRELGNVFNVKFIFWLRKTTVMLLMGESGILLCQGQNVVPSKLLKEGFLFRYKNIEEALAGTSN